MIALTPTHPPPQPATDNMFQLHVHPVNRRRLKQIDRALHFTLKSMSHSYERFGSIKKISSQFVEKRPEKILIYVFLFKSIIFQTGVFTG